MAGKKQIVLRFMVNEFEFWGITNQCEIVICMSSVDKPFRMEGCGVDIILSELFFPMAYKDGKKLSTYAEDLWQAFETVKKKHNIHTDQILMKHFMDAIVFCLKRYGIYGKQLYEPTVEEWIASIEGSGFALAQI